MFEKSTNVMLAYNYLDWICIISQSKETDAQLMARMDNIRKHAHSALCAEMGLTKFEVKHICDNLDEHIGFNDSLTHSELYTCAVKLVKLMREVKDGKQENKDTVER